MTNDEKTANNATELRREAERKVASQLEVAKIPSNDTDTKRLLHELPESHTVGLLRYRERRYANSGMCGSAGDQ